MNRGEIILYQTEDGKASVQLRAVDGTVSLTQLELAVLFQTTKQNVSLHAQNFLTEGELDATSVVKESLTTAADGKSYQTKLYNLDMILAIGYRVRSSRGTQFRQWATTHLREYDELLARIREIRASGKRFYQKVRDIYATAVDYQADSEQALLFFKKVQNKMLWAVTGQTAAELIKDRANPELPNMGLQTWQGSRVRKQDAAVAKNYLKGPEIEELDRIVVMYLDYAEDQARRRKAMSMAEWAARLDGFLTFNERDVLTHPGKVSHEIAEKLAHERYEKFDAKRETAQRLAADASDLKSLEETSKQLEAKKPSRKKEKGKEQT